MTCRWPRLCLPAPCCQGANTCPKKEHVFGVFPSSYLFPRQGAEVGKKEKKPRQLLVRSAAVVLSPSFFVPVDAVRFVLEMLF